MNPSGRSGSQSDGDYDARCTSSMSLGVLAGCPRGAFAECDSSASRFAASMDVLARTEQTVMPLSRGTVNGNWPR